MSVQVDILNPVIEVQIIEDEVVQVAIQDGISILEDGALVSKTRAVNFTGSGVSVQNDIGNNRVTVDISGGGGSSGDLEINVTVIQDGVLGNLLYDAGGVLGELAPGSLPVSIPQALADAAVLASANSYTDSVVKRLVLYKNNTTISLTGDTQENIIDAFLVPANTLESTDTLEMYAYFEKSGTNGNMIIRINTNTSISMSGDTTVANLQSGAANLWAGINRKMFFKAINSQRVMSLSTLSNNSDLASITSAPATITTNFAVDQYFTLTLQLGNGADTGSLIGWGIEIIRS